MDLKFKNPVYFQNEIVPKDTLLVGLAALVHAFGVEAPIRRPSCVSKKHIKGSVTVGKPWTIYDKRYDPGHTFADHLAFALKHEETDLLILKRVFDAVPQGAMIEFVRAVPTGIPSRRGWFLYETLTGNRLPMPDAPNIVAVDALDPKEYFVGKGSLSKRHKVRNNLLGSGRLCPVIRRTEALQAFAALALDERAREVIGRVSTHLIARAASFLLLADTKASFEIEGERPPRNRLERWGRAVLQAGKHPLTMEEIVRLHGVLIEDPRFVRVGLRSDGVFLGERDHDGIPLPEFIGARPNDLEDLLTGLIDANNRMRDSGLDPVLQATATAFGFTYIHPLQDGNGRLHRCLIHHVLAERKFTPHGMVFPVSSVMLDRINDYRVTLQGHSGPLMDFIKWQPTPDRNVEVLNDTADLYRFFDCTDSAEFLYACVQQTVEHDLPREVDYLRRNDEAMRQIMDTVELPDNLAQDFIVFVRQNGGKLSKRRRSNEFAKLLDEEITTLEKVVNDTFDGFEDKTRENKKKQINTMSR
jgi:hypothetical protein